MNRLLPLLLTAALSLPLFAANPSRPLELRFETNAVVAAGGERGGRILFLGVSRELDGTSPLIRRLRRRAVIVDDHDGDGVARLAFEKGVPDLAIWTVVDLGSGAFAAAPTPGYAPMRMELTGEAVKNDSAGQLRKLEGRFSEAEVLLVRPGVGAWRLELARNSLKDENRNHAGPMRLDVAGMLPIGDAPNAPHNFKPGDVVSVIETRWMQYGIIEVGK